MTIRVHTSFLVLVMVSLSHALYSGHLIDMSAPSTLPRGAYSVSSRISPPGGSTSGAGVIFSVDVGLSDRLLVGVGYGGDGLIGRDEVDWYPWPGARIKYHLFNEPHRRWSVATGVDIQGYSGNAPEYRGFVYKSEGVYVTMGRNYAFFNFPAEFIMNINYSFEDVDNVHWPNFGIGTNIRINPEIAAIIEYDFATNQQVKDADPDTYWGITSGFLNLGFSWRFVSSLQFSLHFRDVFSNRIRSKNYPADDSVYGWGREIRLEYFSRF
ncbi:hypothetical protein [Chitinivibrio alkaliphilus]|uniref:Uncharacterized protein n=1 Tax=Chitinivibrio alkaliphilus ACht1 TaxID=1313304 RepID=U7D7W9_9BACT|nr:hypothetical protein [Chitinivibrio alkaliphilus]ERP31187.1 hypothetical protein CALK_1900 [Chitinivibrio alkaliphilus ACht1]